MPMPMTGLKKNPAFDDSVFAEQDKVEVCGKFSAFTKACSF